MNNFGGSNWRENAVPDVRKREARDAAHKWLMCGVCGRLYEGGHWLTLGPGPGPACPCGATSGAHWPGFSAELLVLGLRPDWKDESGRLLGIVLLAASAEVIVEEFLFSYLAARAGGFEIAQAILRQVDTISRRIELLNSMIEGGLKQFWITEKMPKLYDDWGTLREDRNTVAHGEVLIKKLKFGTSPHDFVTTFLSGMACLHNSYLLPSKH